MPVVYSELVLKVGYSAMSERDKLSKERPKLTGFRRKQQAISYWQVWYFVFTNRFSFGERILPHYGTHNVGLFNSRARSTKLRCVFNKVFLVNHCRDIIDCSCKWSCLSN